MFARKPLPPRKPIMHKPVQSCNTARIGEVVAASPKTAPHRSRDLLDLARDQNCLLMIPGVCNGDNRTTVAAHSNWHMHGKSGARKADDEYTVWACARCHTWLDQSFDATMEEKQLAFKFAHELQVLGWIQIAYCESGKEKKAAQWALDMLNKGKT